MFFSELNGLLFVKTEVVFNQKCIVPSLVAQKKIFTFINFPFIQYHSSPKTQIVHLFYSYSAFLFFLPYEIIKFYSKYNNNLIKFNKIIYKYQEIFFYHSTFQVLCLSNAVIDISLHLFMSFLFSKKILLIIHV